MPLPGGARTRRRKPRPMTAAPRIRRRGFPLSSPALFTAAGLSPAAAARVAAALVEADLSGRASHGILQADGYLARLMAGTMSVLEAPVPVSDTGAVVVLDAAGMEGHLAAEEAMLIAAARARQHGLAAVAVRRGFHFGVAGRYARIAAEAGCVGVAMCNTKAVMPAPGGAEALVGTNPLAIALAGPRRSADRASTWPPPPAPSAGSGWRWRPASRSPRAGRWTPTATRRPMPRRHWTASCCLRAAPRASASL